MTEDIDLSRADWRTSSFSGQNGNCVEVATNLPVVVAVRDSKDPEGTTLIFTNEEWRTFVSWVMDGEFGKGATAL
jgi:hypothetical protein